MSKPAQVTDIYKFGDMYAINIDFQRQEYRVSWHGDWRDPPDLGSFPEVPGATVTSIPHSPEVDELWAKSQVLCYGADSHIRLLDQGSDSSDEQFPVCKVAANDRQRQFISDEFEILRDLGSEAAPAVQVHPEPFLDGKGIFGFRMERLLAIGPDTAVSKSKFLKCLEQIHEKGVVHNDFHPMNVMKNRQGQLVVIDFGRSGRVGNKIPTEKRSPWWRAELYSFEADKLSLDKFFCMSQT
jgi:serine/threonine protein kinase